MKWGVALIVAAGIGGILSSCSIQKADLQALRQKADHGQEMASNCLRDSLHVPVQYSGHCLATVRFLKDDSIDQACGGETGLHCRELNRLVHDAHSAYWRGIANTLWVYGKPAEFASPPNSGWSGMSQFYDIGLMEKAFKNCLAAEAAEQSRPVSILDNASERGVAVRVRIVKSPIRPGQKCIREGYADPSSEGRT